MKTKCSTLCQALRLAMLMVGFAFCLAPAPLYASGWLPVQSYAPAPVGTMLLLSDGTVMVQQAGNDGLGDSPIWYRLTPGTNGGYTNGSWSTDIQQMHCSRLYCSSQVLTNGQVFVAGGEYSTNGGGTNAEVYDPVANQWTLCPNTPGPAGFLDSISAQLPDGNVLVAPVHPASYGGTLIWNTASFSWSVGPTLYQWGDQAEASWVKLQDQSILTVDALDESGAPGTTSQRYFPSLNQWMLDGSLPVQLWANLCDDEVCSVGEEGPALLLPNGNAFFIGGSGATAIYQPTGTTNAGTWKPGPEIPDGLASADAPGAMMVNGKILCALAPIPYLSGSNVVYPSPTSFYEYDYSSGTNGAFTQVNAPNGSLTNAGPTYTTRMLCLPDGTVLFSFFDSALYVYVPEGSPLAAGQPAIDSYSWNADGSLQISGTLFNGISEGAAYGDDAQMDSNYPLVRFVDGSGRVYYGRTYNWSSTCVMTGGAIVTTQCTVPATVLDNLGTYSMQVIANGNASSAVTFRAPVWVNFNYSKNSLQIGTYANPFSTLAQGVSAVAAGGTIFIEPGTSSETMTITKAMNIVAIGGTATVGN